MGYTGFLIKQKKMEKLYILKNIFEYIRKDISEDNISKDAINDAIKLSSLKEVHKFIDTHYTLLFPDIILGLFACEYEKTDNGKWVYTGKYILSNINTKRKINNNEHQDND